MKEFFLNQLLKPASHRIASQVGTYLAAYGLAHGQIETVVAALTIVSGLAIDFLVRKVV